MFFWLPVCSLVIFDAIRPAPSSAYGTNGRSTPSSGAVRKLFDRIENAARLRKQLLRQTKLQLTRKNSHRQQIRIGTSGHRQFLPRVRQTTCLVLACYSYPYSYPSPIHSPLLAIVATPFNLCSKPFSGSLCNCSYEMEKGFKKSAPKTSLI